MVTLAGSLHPYAHGGIRSACQRCLLSRLLSKVAASIADQGVASSTNFLLNVFLARWLLPAEYGAYSVCWSILLVLAAFHNALILEPITVIGPADYSTRLRSYLQTAQRLNWPVILCLGFLCLPLAGAYRQPTVRKALLVLSVCLPGYLLLLLVRRRQYVVNQPVRALQLSLLYALLVFGFIAACQVTGRLSVVSAVASFGLAWFVLAVPVKPQEEVINTAQIARQHWHYGKWVFASAILAIGVSDMQTILLSMLVNLNSAGALRALMNFVLPLSQILTVLSVYALPRLSRRAKTGGTQRLLRQGFLFALVLMLIAALYLAALVCFAPALEHLLYSGKMHSYITLVPLLSASALASCIGAAFSTLLRAIQNSQHQFIAGVTGSAVGIACGFYLLPNLGISGALWSMLAANASGTLIIIGTYFWLLRRRHA